MTRVSEFVDNVPAEPTPIVQPTADLETRVGNLERSVDKILDTVQEIKDRLT